MAIGACIQNMLLEAYSLGLGTCWLGEILNKKAQVSKYLNLDEDLEYDLSKIDDPMLQDESEDEEFGYDVSDVEKMLRKLDCEPCAGSDSKRNCKVRDDFDCPPGKESKKKPWTDTERRTSGRSKKRNKEEDEEEEE